MESFTINKDIFSLINCASTDESRFNLVGIYFDEKNHRAVTTNGHVMSWKDIDKEVWETTPWNKIVRLKNKLSKEGKKFPYGNNISFNKVTDSLYTSPLTGDSVEIIDGQFPDVDQVIPNIPTKSQFKVCLDAQYITALAKTITTGNGVPKQGLTFTFDRDNNMSAVMIEGKLGNGLLMPCRTE